MPVQITITNEQRISAALAPVTAAGRPAQLDPSNPPTWTVISGESTVTASSDGMAATIVSSDNPGDTQIMVEADADLGEGVETLSDIITVTVIGARAQNLGISLGNPEPK